MSDTESEKVNCVESSNESSPSRTPPPSRNGSDASSVDSLSASISELNTTTNEFEATSLSQSTTTNEFEATSLSQSTTLCVSGSGSDSDVSDVSDIDQSNYEKELQWSHLDQVPDEVSSTYADTSSTQSTDDTLEKKEDSNDKEDTDVDMDEEDEEEDEDEDEDEEYNEEEDTEEEDTEEEKDSDSCSENHYVYLVPTPVQNESPPLLTFLLFLFLFLHLMHYMLLLKDSQNNKCFPFRH